MKGTIKELPDIDTSKYNIDESGNVLRDKKITDEEKYEEFVNFTCEMLGLNKPIDILKLCQLTSDFIRPYEIKIKELEKENEELKLLKEKMENWINRIKKLKEENEQLKQQIEKMKCCGNCKHYCINDEDEFDCCRSYNCTKFDKWELAE